MGITIPSCRMSPRVLSLIGLKCMEYSGKLWSSMNIFVPYSGVVKVSSSGCANRPFLTVIVRLMLLLLLSGSVVVVFALDEVCISR